MAGLIPFNRKRNDVMNIGFEDFSNMIDDSFTGSWPMQRSLAADLDQWSKSDFFNKKIKNYWQILKSGVYNN